MQQSGLQEEGRAGDKAEEEGKAAQVSHRTERGRGRRDARADGPQGGCRGSRKIDQLELP